MMKLKLKARKCSKCGNTLFRKVCLSGCNIKTRNMGKLIEALKRIEIEYERND